MTRAPIVLRSRDGTNIIDASALENALERFARTDTLAILCAAFPPRVVLRASAIDVEQHSKAYTATFTTLVGLFDNAPFDIRGSVTLQSADRHIWLERPGECRLVAGPVCPMDAMELARILWEGNAPSIDALYWPSTLGPGGDPRATEACMAAIDALPSPGLPGRNLRTMIATATWAQTRHVLLNEYEATLSSDDRWRLHPISMLNSQAEFCAALLDIAGRLIDPE
jgi:hypothetical protein